MDLSSPEDRVHEGQVLACHYSSDSQQGLFTVQETSAEAQASIFTSLDSRMSADLTNLCNGPVTLQDLLQAPSRQTPRT